MRGAFCGKRGAHPANPAARSWPSVTSPAATSAVTCGAVMCLQIGLRARRLIVPLDHGAFRCSAEGTPVIGRLTSPLLARLETVLADLGL
jgi:hypothetical protein